MQEVLNAMILTVHVKPRARENRIEAWLDETTVKVAVTAAPEKGKANEAVFDLLADFFETSRSELALVRGHTTKMKHFSISDDVYKSAQHSGKIAKGLLTNP